MLRNSDVAPDKRATRNGKHVTWIPAPDRGTSLTVRESGAYAHRAEKVLPLLEKVLTTDPMQARLLCEHALRRLYKVCENADDSDGDIGGVVHSLMDLLTRSLQAAPPPAAWVGDWFALMQADPWGLWSEKAVLDAAGPAVRERYHQRTANDWNNWVAAHPPAKVVESAMAGGAKKSSRSGVREADPSVHGSYDHERATVRGRYLNALKSQGDTLAVLDLMRASLTGAAEHGELVAYCESLGKTREALQVAQAAYKLYPGDWRCEKDLLRCYERDGWNEEALAIRRRQLEKSPTAENYQAVLKAARAAGRDPSSYREELFAWAQALETQQTVGGRSSPWARSTPGVTGRHVGTRTEWLLSDGGLDEALALVQPPHVCESRLLRTIALELPEARSREAVPLLLRVFAFAMPGASTPYRDVLHLVKEIASRMLPPERCHWLAQLRAEYKAKRNFIMGLDELAIPE